MCQISKGLAIVAALVAAAVCLMWALDPTGVWDRYPTLLMMKANTALSLLLCAIALLALDERSTWRRGLLYTCVAVVQVIAWATLLEHATHASWSIDDWLVRHADDVSFPTRISVPTSICFLALSAAAVLIERKVLPRVTQCVLLCIGAAAVATLGGYLYRSPGLTPATHQTVVAPHTAVCLLFLAARAMVLTGDVGLIHLLISPMLAGSVMRRLLPVT
ncbi:MAG: hypothetical protein ACTHM6_11770, partial [Tepidisphaeraceae bacterium]